MTLDVQSDGAYDPKDAVNHAASILRNQLGLFLFSDSSEIKAVDEEKMNETLIGKGDSVSYNRPT